MKRRLENGLKE
jgi:endonuclease-3